jgi:hypothetical protein
LGKPSALPPLTPLKAPTYVLPVATIGGPKGKRRKKKIRHAGLHGGKRRKESSNEVFYNLFKFFSDVKERINHPQRKSRFNKTFFYIQA